MNDGMNFDVSGLLSPEEAERLFDVGAGAQGGPDAEEEPVEGGDGAADAGEAEGAKGANGNGNEAQAGGGDAAGGAGDGEGRGDAAPEGAGASPDVLYSSIARALKDDDILHFDDSEIDAVKGYEALGDLLEREVAKRLDDRRRRVDEAMRDGVPAGDARNFERTVEYLDGISDDAVSDEGDDGEDLRRQLIYNELLLRGYTQERANRELEKSIKAGTDVEDARDALDTLRRHWHSEYDKARKAAKSAKEAADKASRSFVEELRKSVVDSEVEVGGVKLDEATRRRAYEATTKPAYRDPKTGKVMTATQRLANEDPISFFKLLGLAYALTDGGKDWSKLTGRAERKGRHDAMRELERKINNTSVNSDGSLRLVGGEGAQGGDLLLDGGWKVG